MQSNKGTNIGVVFGDSQNAFFDLSLKMIQGYGGGIQRVSMSHIHKAWLA